MRLAPILNAPFSATLATEWAQKLEDGTTVPHRNHRTIMRELSLAEPSAESFRVPGGYTVRHHNQAIEDSENAGTK